MLGRTWITLTLSLALPFALGACGGDKDGGGGTTDTGPGGGGPPPSALEAFDDGDWYGTCTLGSNEFPCEADLTYDSAADEVTGSMDIDGIWEVVITEGDDGAVSGSGLPFFGDDMITLSNLAVDGDGNMTGDFTIDYGGSTADGTLSMSDAGPTG